MQGIKRAGGVIAGIQLLTFVAGCATTQPARPTPPAEVVPVGAVDEVEITIWVRGLDCTSCVRLLRKEMMKVPGMQEVIIDPSMGILTAVLRVSGEPSQEPVISAMERAGFSAVRVEMPEPGAE